MENGRCLVLDLEIQVVTHPAVIVLHREATCRAARMFSWRVGIADIKSYRRPIVQKWCQDLSGTSATRQRSDGGNAIAPASDIWSVLVLEIRDCRQIQTDCRSMHACRFSMTLWCAPQAGGVAVLTAMDSRQWQSYKRREGSQVQSSATASYSPKHSRLLWCVPRRCLVHDSILHLPEGPLKQGSHCGHPRTVSPPRWNASLWRACFRCRVSLACPDKFAPRALFSEKAW